ncbi:tetratricopeptide repeat protein [bacterium]|nr:tetratricopeptide repeat protein [candidate division CSSED10-310 bacterium]
MGMWPSFILKNNDSIKPDRNFKKRIKKLEKQLKLLKNKENSKAEAKCFEEIGFLYFDQKLYDQAIENWTNALRVYQETNDRPSMAESYSNIGTALRLKNSLRQATSFYTKALVLDHEFNKGEGELKSLHNLGGTWLELGEYENALEAYNNALETARHHLNKTWEALTLYRLGETYEAGHKFLEAFRFYEEGLKIADALHFLEVMTRCTFGLGKCYEMLGEYTQSQLCYEDSSEGAKNLNDSDIETLIWVARAFLNIHLGYLDQAREMSKKAQDISQNGSISITVNIELALLRAKIYAIQGMWEKVFRLLDEAEKNAEKLPNGYYLSKVMLRKAEFEISCGHYENALALIFQMNGKYSEGKSTLIDFESSLSLGHIYRGLKKDDQALAAREAAVLKAQALGSPQFLWISHHSLGRLYHQQQRFDEARDHYQSALKWIDRAASSLNPEERPIFLHNKERLQVYQDFVILQLTTGHKEIAARTLKRLNSETLYRKVQHFFK